MAPFPDSRIDQHGVGQGRMPWNEEERIESLTSPRASKEVILSIRMSMAGPADPFLEGRCAGRNLSRGGLRDYTRDHKEREGLQQLGRQQTMIDKEHLI